MTGYLNNQPSEGAATKWNRFARRQENFTAPAQVAAVMDDFEVPEFMAAAGSELNMINMWIGGTNAINGRHSATSGAVRSLLHMDSYDNLYAVLKGHKNFTIYSPRHAVGMYQRGGVMWVSANGQCRPNNEMENPNFSTINDPDDPDHVMEEYAHSIHSLTLTHSLTHFHSQPSGQRRLHAGGAREPRAGERR